MWARNTLTLSFCQGDPGCGEIGSGKYPRSTCLELQSVSSTTTYISLHLCINKNRTGISASDRAELFRGDDCAPAPVSSSLRKLVNKSASSGVAVPSLLFYKYLFLIHLCLILLVFLSGSALTCRDLASESFDQCLKVRAPWSHRSKKCFCSYFSIVSTSTQVRERLGGHLLEGQAVALKLGWRPGFLDPVPSSHRSFLVLTLGHVRYPHFLGLKGKFWSFPTYLPLHFYESVMHQQLF